LDLAEALNGYFARAETWALRHVLEAYQPELGGMEERLFSALEWYNRSAASSASEDVALVNLVTAFESMLGLGTGPKVTERFRETVQVLIGFIPRLDSVLEQLYDARSKIAHRGSWTHLRFYATGRENYYQVVAGKEKEGVPAHYPLTIYGRRIFRICVDSLLSGAILAVTARLEASLFHNQERLETICATLQQRKAMPADARILSVRKEVVELLEQYGGMAEEGVSFERLLETGVLMVRAFLELKLDLNEEVGRLADAITQSGASEGIDAQLARFEQLSDALEKWKGSRPQYQFEHDYVPPDDPVVLVQLLLDYINKPGFRLRRYWEAGG